MKTGIKNTIKCAVNLNDPQDREEEVYSIFRKWQNMFLARLRWKTRRIIDEINEEMKEIESDEY